MTRKQQLAGLVILGALTVAWHYGHFAATARQPDEAGGVAAWDIAVLDVARAFKENGRLNGELAELKKEVGYLDIEFRIRGKEIERLQQQLAAAPVGSPEREKLSDELIDRKAEAQADREKLKGQLLQREAILYRETMAQVTALAEAYSREHGIRLVIRFNGDSTEATSQGAILKSVNRAIIFQDGLDITDAIIERLNAPNDVDA